MSTRAAGSIGRLLQKSIAGACILLAVAAAAILAGALHQHQTVDEVTLRTQPLLVKNAELREDFASSVAGLSGYLLTHDASFLTSYLEAHGEYPGSLAAERRLAGSDVRGYVAEQVSAASAWYTAAGVALAEPPRAAGVEVMARAADTVGTFFDANSAMQAVLSAKSTRLITAGRRSLVAGLAVSAAALLAVIAMALLASLGVVRRITRPLIALTAALRRLAAGDHAARAEVAGVAEVREAARSVNALADESDRLRHEEAEHNRLRACAREAGIRIREHLSPSDVIREACTAIEQTLDCDLAFMHLVSDGQMGRPEYRDLDVPLPAGFLADLPTDLSWAHELLRNHTSMVIQDLRGEEGDIVPPVVREQLLALGVVSHLLTPFGLGTELVGVISGERLRPGHPWTAAEVDAFESIAGDIRRGLHYARQYEAENRLVAELKALDRAKSDFLATVSHELRTPLTSIAGYVELLRDTGTGPVNDDQDRMLETIGRNAARLRVLIEHVLTLSKIELSAVDAATRPAAPAAATPRVPLPR